MPASTPAPLVGPRTASASPRKRVRRRVLLWATLVLEVFMLMYAGTLHLCRQVLDESLLSTADPDPCRFWLALPDSELPQPG